MSDLAFLTLVFVNFKRLMKDKIVMLLSFLMPLVVITAVYFISNKEPGGTASMVDISFNVLDKGEYGSKMLKDLNISKSIYYNYNQSKVMELVEKNDVVAVYVIPEDFTDKIKNGEKPSIKAYKKQEGNGTVPVERAVEDEINKKVKEHLLINKNIIQNGKDIEKSSVSVQIKNSSKDIDGAMMITLTMLINFIMYSANGVGTELLNLRRQKILFRCITTANKGWRIVGSLYLAMFFQIVTVYSLVYLIEKFIIGYSFASAHIVLVSIILIAAISISLGIFVTRLFQNESVVTLIITLVCTATTFLSVLGLGIQVKKMHWVLENIVRFTPQYWIFNSIDTGKIFPNVFVLILMAVVLFTAGNVKLRDFASR